MSEEVKQLDRKFSLNLVGMILVFVFSITFLNLQDSSTLDPIDCHDNEKMILSAFVLICFVIRNNV